MAISPREKHGICHQANILVATFRQNRIAHALRLIWPVARRRCREIAHWCLSPFSFFSGRRRLFRELTAKHFPILPVSKPQILGNYAAYTARLTPDSIAYSVGVGGDIRFDLALIEATSCTVHLFDPTPRSARFMNRFSGEIRLQFHPWGVWTQDETVRFYADVTLRRDTTGMVIHDYRSGSITNITAADKWFDADCLTLFSTMQRLGHRHLDLLKMDIEGAALDVMEHLWTTDIRPGQIIVEFEVPRKARDLHSFLIRLESLLTRLKDDGYFLVPLDRGPLHTDSIELLAVRS